MGIFPPQKVELISEGFTWARQKNLYFKVLLLSYCFLPPLKVL
jgi:hypothetical protein